jgi:polyhydroxybutyrate depolymerase
MVATVVVAGTACSTTGTSPATSVPDHTPQQMAAVAPGPAVPSAGCATPAGPAVTDQRQDVQVDGVDRWYLLDTPAPTTPDPTTPTSRTSGTAKATPRPLVLDFHGLAEGAILHSKTSQFGVLGQKDGFVVAFPNGTGTPVQWDTTTKGSANADLQFVTALLGQIEGSECIDTSRVYASGFSDGSFMVSQLACTMSGRFAAIAAVSGLQLPTPCPTTRKVPIISFHGTADPILFFNGGLGLGTLNRVLGRTPPSSATTTTTLPLNLHGPGYPATVQAWAVKDGCDPHPTDHRQSSQVILRTYRCPPGTGVEFYIIVGGGHSWPGSAFSRSISAVTGFTTFQIDATSLIWQFFQRFRL